MKKLRWLIPHLVFLTLLLSSCVFKSGTMTLSSPERLKNVATVSVAKVEIINHQLVVTGKNFDNVSNVKIEGSSFNETFSIESKTSTKIIANSLQAISLGVGSLFNLILSDANAAATFQIDFSLCNSSLNGKGFDCSITPLDREVLSYDAASEKWVPRTLNLSGLNYLGVASGLAIPAVTANSDYWIINVAGGGYSVGDWIVSNGTTWDKVSSLSALTTVHGRIGAVVGAEGDYNLNQMSDVVLGSLTGADNGKVLQYNGTNWVPGTIVTAPAAGSITATEIADTTITNAKIADLAASKITGTVSAAQIGAAVIANSHISGTAAIDYSKLNVPAGAIPYAKLSIADGDIPQAAINGLSTSLSGLIEDAVTNGVLTKAPTENAVFDLAATKLNLTGGTLTAGTINGIPNPLNADEVANMAYVNQERDTRVAKAGDTMTGALVMNAEKAVRFADTDSSHYVGIKSPAVVATSFDFVLPDTKGTSGYVLKTDGLGNLSWLDLTSVNNMVSSASIVDGTIVDADINASANITASKLGTGVVDNAEFNYLNGVTSAIQAQIDTKEVAASVPAHVRATDLTGFSAATSRGSIGAGDTVLSAINKLAWANSDYVSKSENQTLNGTVAINQLTGDLIVPAPFGPSSAVNKTYVDTADALKLNLAGGTMTGALINTTATNATSASTGALILSGGAGIAQNTWIGGLLNVAGNVGIGLGAASPAASLDIMGADILGTGIALNVENSAGNPLVSIKNDGTLAFGGALAGNTVFGNTGGASNTTIQSGTGGTQVGSANSTTTIGDAGTAASATVIQGGSTGGVQIGAKGSVLTLGIVVVANWTGTWLVDDQTDGSFDILTLPAVTVSSGHGITTSTPVFCGYATSTQPVNNAAGPFMKGFQGQITATTATSVTVKVHAMTDAGQFTITGIQCYVIK